MQPFTRRRFLQYGAGVGSALGVPWALRNPEACAAAGGKLVKYLEPLPLPGAGIVVATPSAPNTFSFTQRQISRQLHPQLPPTPLWAYDDGSGLGGQAGSFGMAVVAQSGTPLTVNYTHNLPATYPSWIPVDTRLTPMGNDVRLMTHLHGGFVAATSDGNPAITPDGFGPGETQTVLYTNQPPHMPASLLWFHDHGMGTTRLNVFAGLAAAYIVRDEFDTGHEPNPIGIPGGAYEIPLVVQDRQFNVDGTFRYPVSDIEGVTWIGEYFGDVMLVNGKVWPYLNVEPRMYRLRILNGCNARILNLDIGGPTFWQIGAEGGLFDVPVQVKEMVLPVTTRFITLNEIDPEEITWYLNLNGLHFDEPATETPRVGTVEDWVYVNLTGDTHPMHMHLVTFQVVGRTPFAAEAYEAAYGGPNGVPGGIDPTPFATGPMLPPAPEERGFKDTVKANPGYFTTIRAKFELPDGVIAPQTYVHHCHIVEHEDNDMMRPFTVMP